MYGGSLPDIGRRDARSGRSYNGYTPDYMPSNRNAYNNTTYRGGNDTIKVSGIDLFIKYNTKAHHTNEFDITNGEVYGNRDEMLVVRRGQEFFIDIKFNRTYDAKSDVLRLFLQLGKHPSSSSKESTAELSPSAGSSPSLNEWGSSIHSQDGNSVTLTVAPPPRCPVGKWYLKINVGGSGGKSSFEHSDPIYILFNPWCKDDLVYMKDEELLGEYILNETGKLYCGTSEKITHFPWNFGQFSGNVLDCVMYLLEISGLPDNVRADPVLVSRRFSSLINSPDNNGVLVGKWSGSYADGNPPLSWTGSVEILEEYYRTRRPVKYGQCWVFSGVLTAVCRALGIPARSVTNFTSAHDTDGSVTIDTYFDSNMDEIKELNHDSIWNFHVWNDVWMTRPDLPRGYSGWQALDATPQERSGDVFRMGPTSLTAIRNGHVKLPYDGPFVFAEVNGDEISWMRGSRGKPRVLKIDKDKIGKFISTKKPFAHSSGAGSDIDREDITHLYKFTEGSSEERAAVQRARRQLEIDNAYETEVKDVAFELTTDNNTFIGQTLKLSLKINNRSQKKRSISGHVKVVTTLYTGDTYKDVVSGSISKVVLMPREDKSFYMDVSPDRYMDKLADHCIFNIKCSFMVEETSQAFTENKEVRLRKPHLTIEAPDIGYVGQTFRVRTFFKNPLSEKLTNCQVRVEGPGQL